MSPAAAGAPARRSRRPRAVAAAPGRSSRVTAVATLLMAGAGLYGRHTDDDVEVKQPEALPAMPVPGAVRGPWVVDALDRPGQWKASTDESGGRCSFKNGLSLKTSSFALVCPGTAETFAGDQSISADITVDNAQSCAEVQFRSAGESSYWLDLCPRTVRIRHEGTVRTTTLVSADQALFTPGQRRKVVLGLHDEVASVTVDGTGVLTTKLTDPSLPAGKVAFGVAPTDQARNSDVPIGALVTRAEIRPVEGVVPSAAPARPFTDVRRGSTKSIVKVHAYYPKTRSVVVEPVLFMTGEEYCETFQLKPTSDNPCERAWLTEDSRMVVTLPISAAPKLFSTFDNPESCAGDPVTVGTCAISPAKFAARLADGGLAEVTTAGGTVTAMADVYTP